MESWAELSVQVAKMWNHQSPLQLHLFFAPEKDNDLTGLLVSYGYKGYHAVFIQIRPLFPITVLLLNIPKATFCL